MNVQIIAAGRTIFIAECHGSTEECADIALGLWQQTEPEIEEELGGGTGFQTEREYRPAGFVDVSLEQPDVR